VCLFPLLFLVIIRGHYVEQQSHQLGKPAGISVVVNFLDETASFHLSPPVLMAPIPRPSAPGTKYIGSRAGDFKQGYCWLKYGAEIDRPVVEQFVVVRPTFVASSRYARQKKNISVLFKSNGPDRTGGSECQL
jgi:hypothetical protein